MGLRSAQGNEFGPMTQPVKGVPLRLTRWAWSLLMNRPGFSRDLRASQLGLLGAEYLKAAALTGLSR